MGLKECQASLRTRVLQRDYRKVYKLNSETHSPILYCTPGIKTGTLIRPQQKIKRALSGQTAQLSEIALSSHATVSPLFGKPHAEITFSEFHSQILNTDMDHQIFEESVKYDGQRSEQTNKKVLKGREERKKFFFIITNVLTEIRKILNS